MVDGLAKKFDMLLQVVHERSHQTGGSSKSEAARHGQGEDVRALRRGAQARETPSGLQQTVGCRDSLPSVPCESGPVDRHTTVGLSRLLHDLRGFNTAHKIQAWTEMYESIVRARIGPDVRREALDRSYQDQAMRALRAYLSCGTCSADDMQPILRELARMDEASCRCSRVNRLRALGNGWVPSVAATAWRLLTARIEHAAEKAAEKDTG
jgi:hypothetical protein